MADNLLMSLTGKDHITAQDVLAVRAAVFPDMTVSPDEAEAIFAINDTARAAAPEWRAFFVEAMTDYVVRQREPHGYVDEASAQWLMDRIVRDGQIKSQTELELLVYILEQAEQAPRALSEFAVLQVARRALTNGRAGEDGPTLTPGEVAMLRRVLYAFAGTGGGAAISQEEAAALFALNNAARGRPNDPAWTDLFVHAIGSAFLAAEGYHALSPEEAMRREAWLKEPPQAAGSFLARGLRGLLAGKAFEPEPDEFGDRNRQWDLATQAASPISQAEAAWLTAQIGKDGVLDHNEIALLQFLAKEASTIDPSLQGLIDQAQAAAPAYRAAS